MSELLDFASAVQCRNPQKFAAGCDQLYQILCERNKVCNLTRITDREDFDLKHIIDSLAIALDFPEVANSSLAVADIGCGAGFPSLVLAMAFPSLRITPIDSTGKKIAFVSDAAAALALDNITPVCGRANELNRKNDFKHRFDLVTARAVAPSYKIAAETTNFLNRRGRYVFYKTPIQRDEELPVLAKDKKYQWSVTETRVFPHGERLFITGKSKNA